MNLFARLTGFQWRNCWRWLGFLMVWFGALGSLHAQQAVPLLNARVVDSSGALTSAQRNALEAKLAAFEKTSGSQLVVLLVPSTQPEDIASYANRVANSWKIGRKDVGDGLLLIVALQDRKVRIEVAKTLEGAIPDLAAKRVIDLGITPRFKQGDYAGGLDVGAEQLMALVKGEALPAPVETSSSDGHGSNREDLAVFIFFGVLMVSQVAKNLMGVRLGSLATAGLAGVATYWITASLLVTVVAGLAALAWTALTGVSGKKLGRSSGGFTTGGIGGGSGFGSSSDFGGGFSSGGGGDFGGGGASGDW